MVAVYVVALLGGVGALAWRLVRGTDTGPAPELVAGLMGAGLAGMSASYAGWNVVAALAASLLAAGALAMSARWFMAGA